MRRDRIAILMPYFCRKFYYMAEAKGKVRTFTYNWIEERKGTYVILENYGWMMRTVKDKLDSLVEARLRSVIVRFPIGIGILIPTHVPERFRDLVALYEIERENTLLGLVIDAPKKCNAVRERKAQRDAHRQGCEAELTTVFNRGQFFANPYALWMVERQVVGINYYFQNAIPGFMIRSGRSHLGVLVDFFLKLTTGVLSEQKRKEEMVKTWPWMSTYL